MNITQKKIRELGKVVTGKTPSTKRLDFFGAGYPFITPSDIDKFDVRYLPKTERFLSEEGMLSQRNLLIPENAISLVCIGSTIGKICMTSQPSFTNQQLNSLIPNERFSPLYLFYLIRYYVEDIQNIVGGTGAGKAILNKSSYENLTLKVCESRSAQEKIAGILGAYDDLIENNAKRIKILEEMAQAIYKEWFIDFKFPGYKKVSLKSSELGKIPEQWNVKKLKDVSTLLMGQSPKSEYYNYDNKGLPFHQGVSNFCDRFIENEVFCSELNRVASEGSILFSVRAPVGRINITRDKIIIGRGLCSINSHRKSNSFLFYQLKSIFVKDDIIGNGAIFASVSKDEVENIKIILPQENLLVKFEDIITEIDKQIENLTLKNKNLKQTRDLLLPKLISGEIDVEKMDIKI